MIWFLIGFILLLIIIAVLCFSYIHVEADYKRKGKNDRFKVDVKAVFGLVRLKYEIPEIKLNGLDGIDLHSEMVNTKKNKVIKEHDEQIGARKVQKRWKQTKKLLTHTADLMNWMTRTMKHLKCTMLKWHTIIGLTEAHFTAISVGSMWAIKAPIIAWFTKLVEQQSKPDVDIQPAYNTNYFSTEALCIVKIRFGYAIFAGLLLIIRIVKVKGGIKTWKNILFKA